ncbi:unnamed protein product [Prorocentrum cordatum]|uniref:Uncharacterized protein n=1 Tax=Prorocentrum cordatum TaxID=2364126 RepID=A0ABN9V612_9DINO|nr:unnamed protein product [Polarella glacialis]
MASGPESGSPGARSAVSASGSVVALGSPAALGRGAAVAAPLATPAWQVHHRGVFLVLLRLHGRVDGDGERREVENAELTPPPRGATGCGGADRCDLPCVPGGAGPPKRWADLVFWLAFAGSAAAMAQGCTALRMGPRAAAAILEPNWLRPRCPERGTRGPGNCILFTQDMQKAYEAFVIETNASIEAKTKAIVNKSEEKAKAEEQLVAAQADLDSVTTELGELADYNAQLHASCDFTLKNFALRQEGRGGGGPSGRRSRSCPARTSGPSCRRGEQH